MQAWWIYRGYNQRKQNLESQLSLALEHAVGELNTKQEIAFIAKVGSDELKEHQRHLNRAAADMKRLEERQMQRIRDVEDAESSEIVHEISVVNSATTSIVTSDSLSEKQIDSLLASIDQNHDQRSGAKSGASASVIVSDDGGSVSTSITWSTDDSALVRVLEFQRNGRLEELVERIERENMLAERGFHQAINTQLLAATLTKNLSDLGINQSFEFAVLSNDSLLVEPFESAGYHGLKADLMAERSLFPYDLISKDAVLNVKLATGFGSIMKQLWPMVLASVVFSVLMLVLFALTVNRLLSQTRLSQLKTDFINNMSHELKTPLATISLAADTMLLDSIPKEKINEFAKTIKKEHHRIHEHIERVLNMAQAEKDKLEMEKSLIDVSAFANTIAQDLELILKEKKAVLSLEVQEDLPRFEADEFHFRAALTNLIDNALKYSQADPKVSFSIQQQNGLWRFEISDQGIGMTSEEQRLAFEPFYRAETGNQQSTKGFGLGLSYVKMIVKAHGGEIKLNSEVGKGTSVALIFKQ